MRVCVKVIGQVNALALERWYEVNDTMKVVSAMLDKVWFVFATIIPMLKELFVLTTRGDKVTPRPDTPSPN